MYNKHHKGGSGPTIVTRTMLYGCNVGLFLIAIAFQVECVVACEMLVACAIEIIIHGQIGAINGRSTAARKFSRNRGNHREGIHGSGG
jgi:hypothetical protein